MRRFPLISASRSLSEAVKTAAIPQAAIIASRTFTSAEAIEESVEREEPSELATRLKIIFGLIFNFFGLRKSNGSCAIFYLIAANKSVSENKEASVSTNIRGFFQLLSLGKISDKTVIYQLEKTEPLFYKEQWAFCHEKNRRLPF